MAETYYLPKARNTRTGQTVKDQDLSGGRFNKRFKHLAEDRADQLAAAMSARTGDTWTGFIESYTPTVRNEQTEIFISSLRGNQSR